MAVAVSNVKDYIIGNQFKKVATVTFDSSYPTGGETLNASSFGLAFFEDIVVNDSTGYTFTPSIAAGGATALVLVYYGDNNNASDGPLIELPNATNISTLAVTVTAYGK